MFNNMVTLGDARLYAEELTDWHRGRTYVFGSVAREGIGNDLDLILEVHVETFLAFVTECIGMLNGFHPVTMETLPLASSYWDYFSPKEARTKYALNVIGLQEGDRSIAIYLDRVVPLKQVDLLCLPVGWRRKGFVQRMLRKAFEAGHDPRLLENILTNSIRVR